METITPKKLKSGDEVRILSLAQSASIINLDILEKSKKQLESLGLRVSYGKRIFNIEALNSLNNNDKILDLHEAFADNNVKAIFAAIGGFDSNQILDDIDWSIISKNPKIFAGFSDITVLNHAIFAQTGLVTYAAPNFYCLGLPPEADYSLAYLQKCIFEKENYIIEDSCKYYDYPWKYDDYSDRPPIKNIGSKVISPGKAGGILMGGTMCSLNLLNGTPYMPIINEDIVLMIEDDGHDSIPVTFERNLKSISQQKYFNNVKCILIGRFQNDTLMTKEILNNIIQRNKALRNIPIAYNLDFGHTDPKFTYPIGGRAIVEISDKKCTVEIIVH